MCRDVTVSRSNAGENALGGMIIGGIIGKALTGQDNGAAAGAVIGGVIGADKARQTNEVRRVCNDETRLITKEVIKHYAVEYCWNNYCGEFTTKDPSYRPNQRITLNLKLTRF